MDDAANEKRHEKHERQIADLQRSYTTIEAFLLIVLGLQLLVTVAAVLSL